MQRWTTSLQLRHHNRTNIQNRIESLNMEVNSSNELKASRYGPKNLFRLSDLSIGKRLTACFVAIVVLMIAVDVLTVWQFRRMAAAVEGLSNADQTSLAVIRVHLDIDTFRDKMAALANSHDTQQFSSEVASLEQRFLQDVGQAEQMLRASGQTEQNAAISSALETLKVTLPSQLHTAIELANAGDWTAVRLRLGQQMQDLIGLSASLVERVNQQTLLERTQAIESYSGGAAKPFHTRTNSCPAYVARSCCAGLVRYSDDYSSSLRTYSRRRGPGSW